MGRIKSGNGGGNAADVGRINKMANDLDKGNGTTKVNACTFWAFL